MRQLQGWRFSCFCLDRVTGRECRLPFVEVGSASRTSCSLRESGIDWAHWRCHLPGAMLVLSRSVIDALFSVTFSVVSAALLSLIAHLFGVAGELKDFLLLAITPID